MATIREKSQTRSQGLPTLPLNPEIHKIRPQSKPPLKSSSVPPPKENPEEQLAEEQEEEEEEEEEEENKPEGLRFEEIGERGRFWKPRTETGGRIGNGKGKEGKEKER